MEVRLALVEPVDWVKIGAAGVDLFFVISGFVMVHAAGDLATVRGAPRNFLLRRLARIVPLYWATTTILCAYFLVSGMQDVTTLPRLLASFFFLPVDGAYPIHGLGWTLNYEMLFYVLFAGALLFPLRIAVTGLTVLFVAAVVAGRTSPLPPLLSFWFQPIILEFCFGMLIALVHRAGVRIPQGAALALTAAAVATIACSAVLGASPADWRFAVWGGPAVALVAAAVLIEQPARQGQGRVVRFLVVLGDASYALYLLHALVFAMLRRLGGGLLAAQGAWIAGTVLLVAAVAAALVTYGYFERPVTRMLYRRIGRVDVGNGRNATLARQVDKTPVP